MFPKDCRVWFSANAVWQRVPCWRSGVWKGTLAKPMATLAQHGCNFLRNDL